MTMLMMIRSVTSIVINIRVIVFMNRFGSGAYDALRKFQYGLEYDLITFGIGLLLLIVPMMMMMVMVLVLVLVDHVCGLFDAVYYFLFRRDELLYSMREIVFYFVMCILNYFSKWYFDISNN